MTTEGDRMVGRAADLRRAFDQAFGDPPPRVAEETEGLLALRMGGVAYAVRLTEITGLFADRAIVRLPSPVAELLGVAGLRHGVVPVYSLRALLGHATGGDSPRWMVIARAAYPVALAFEHFEGYLRVPPSAVLPATDRDRGTHVAVAIRHADGMRGVVGIASLLKTIEERVRGIVPTKEQ